jgi:murein DD-endopeptidase MepM/ murein hydrolase activator NlpD
VRGFAIAIVLIACVSAEPRASDPFTPRADDAPRVVRRDTVTGAGAPDRRFVRAVRDLVENRFDVDALPWETRISFWTVDNELVAFSILRDAELGGPVHATRVVTEGDEVRWILQDGSSLDGPTLSRPVRYTAISSKVGLREHPIRRQVKFHAGTDYAAPVGTPIRSIAHGKVVKSGKNWVSGNWLAIRHDDGSVSKYLHLDAIERGIIEGARVGQGETIGYVGKTGRVTGPHLHFELRDRFGYPVDMSSARWPAARRLDDVSARRAFEQRFALLRTWRGDGSRAWRAPLLTPRDAVGSAPPQTEPPQALLPPLPPVRAGSARARLTPPPARVRRRKLACATPLFPNVRSDDPLLARTVALASEFPDDPAFR